MRALYAFMRAITCLNSWVGRISAYLIIPIFLLILAEVFMRYLFGAPAVWTNELSQLTFGVYAIIAGGYLAIDNSHVNVDIVHDQFPPAAGADRCPDLDDVLHLPRRTALFRGISRAGIYGDLGALPIGLESLYLASQAHDSGGSCAAVAARHRQASKRYSHSCWR